MTENESGIIRKPKYAGGGITAEERAQMEKIAQQWIKIAMRTDSIDQEKITDAIHRLYDSAGLKRPRVVVVPSPMVGAFAYGAAAAIWYERKHGSKLGSKAPADASMDLSMPHPMPPVAVGAEAQREEEGSLSLLTHLDAERATQRAVWQATSQVTSNPIYNNVGSGVSKDDSEKATEGNQNRRVFFEVVRATTKATENATADRTRMGLARETFNKAAQSYVVGIRAKIRELTKQAATRWRLTLDSLAEKKSAS